MGRCVICGQVNGHAEGCPNVGNEFKEHESEVRCIFCGTINYVGAKKCRSCNASLDGSIIRERVDNMSPKRECHSFDSSLIRPLTVGEDVEEGSNKCPNCGYLLRMGVKECPNCQNVIVQEEDEEKKHKHSALVNRNQSEPVWNMTTSEFKIGLCDKNGNIGEAKTFAESDVVLGRDELAPNDNHISRKHIHITNEGGQWYVEDVSSTHQTYIVVKGKTPIDNGDVIVLGNKFFRFVTE